MLLSERPEPDGVRKRRGGWKAALPPPLPYRGGFECAAILDELQGELGLIAFQRARDVLVWVTAPVHQRGSLFRRSHVGTSTVPDSAADVATAFRTLNRLVTQPAEVSTARIADACTTISHWAAANAFPETAVWYAELAALAEPGNPQRAWLVGRALRQNHHYERSRQWLERTVGLARRLGNRSVQGAAYLSLGNLEFHIGNHRTARRWWTTAWRLARKYHLDHAAPARHHLMRLCMIQGKFLEAEEHAAAAFELYDPADASFPGFAHDAAQLWSWQAYFGLAVAVFQAVMPLLTPKEQFIAAANLARAAAGAGDRARFLDAWEEVEKRVSVRNEYVAEGLASVAEGAQFLGLTARAAELAKRAEAIARESRLPDTVELAQAIQQRVRTSAPAPKPIQPPDHVRALATRILRALER
jgi:tetratricopeptide (TPR) repeat protein